jgi:hypothetical protein
VPFRPKGAGVDDIAALVQAEIDEIECRIARAEAATKHWAEPSVVKSVAPIKTTLVTPGNVDTAMATPVLETSPIKLEVPVTPEDVHPPVVTPAESEVATPTQKGPVYSAVRETLESPVLADEPRPEEYVLRTNSGLFGEIRRTLTFEEKYVEDWDEEQELDEYTDEFEEVLKEYAQKSREVGLDIVRIGSVRRSI